MLPQCFVMLLRCCSSVVPPPPGALSDDPLFPKAPWPGPSLCASCHEEKNGVHEWNRENVLAFLRQHYGVANLSPKYSLTPLHLSAPPPDPVQTDRPQEKQQGGAGVLGLGFNSVDMSLCVVLYMSSCLVLMLLFFFFKVRSKKWKHRRSHLQV